MDVREGLTALSERYALDDARARALRALAGLGREPASLSTRLRPGLMGVGLGLLGLGLLLWVAANWDALGKLGRFGLLQSVFLLAVLVAWTQPARRAAWALLAWACVGALLALMGQTYQTGADTWELFAMWAGLGLPLALGARSDLIWVPTAVVAMLSLNLWLKDDGAPWLMAEPRLPRLLLAMAWLALLNTGLSPLLRRWTGAGLHGSRTALLCGLLVLLPQALAALFARHQIAAGFFLSSGLLLLGLLACLWRRPRDLFQASALSLSLNLLAVCLAGRWLFEPTLFEHGSEIGRLLLLGLMAALLLSLTVSGLMRWSRAETQGDRS